LKLCPAEGGVPTTERSRGLGKLALHIPSKRWLEGRGETAPA
jgi:hypothetical protein